MAAKSAAGTALCKRLVDAGSLSIEPAVLRTSRVSSEWPDLVPHVGALPDEVVARVLQQAGTKPYHLGDSSSELIGDDIQERSAPA